MNSTSVQHTGVVDEIHGSHVRVRFTAHSACSSCHAKGACSLSELETKYVEVKNTSYDLQVGDKVQVLLENKLGLKAVWYGYVIPLLLLVGTMTLTISVLNDEGLAALLSIGILVPYYLILYLLRNRLSETFRFSLHTEDNLSS